MYTDTHCHLNTIEFENDIKEIISRAKRAEVNQIIVPGIDLKSSKAAYTLAQNFDIISSAAGYHPNYIQTASIENLGELVELISKPEIVAVGEIGLDYYRQTTNVEEQRKIFQYLLSIASQEAKPAIIHSRAAEEDVLSILQVYKPDGLRGVWHCFEGDRALATRILDLGFYIGFTGNITYSDHQDINEVIKNIPLDRILIETDAPYLTPTPYRGKKNEPAYVVEVARKIGDIKNIAIEVVAQTTTENAIKLFNL
ncbi:MAG: TatD family hydrolase [Patescibacteria group bacterium]